MDKEGIYISVNYRLIGHRSYHIPEKRRGKSHESDIDCF